MNWKGNKMSNIPKFKRSPSKLQAIHDAYKIRSRITQELMCSFGYSQKKFERHINKVTAYIKDSEERNNKQAELRKLEQGFDVWFIRKERNDILVYAKGIVNHLVAANTIYPSYKVEFDERRLEMDKALECCNCLQQELQYLIEVLPADVNKYTSIVLEIDKLFNTIKKLRQSDNRFLKNLKDYKVG